MNYLGGVSLEQGAVLNSSETSTSLYLIKNMDDAQLGLNIFKNENTLSDLKYLFAYELFGYQTIAFDGYKIISLKDANKMCDVA